MTFAFGPDGDQLVEVDGKPCVHHVTRGPDDSYRSISAHVIDQPGNYTIETSIRTGELPVREGVTVAVLGGVTLELVDSSKGPQLTWNWRYPDHAEVDRVASVDWTPGEWHAIEVTGEWATDESGQLTVTLDGQLAGEVKGCPTWNLGMPRAWLVGALNLRDEMSMGEFDTWHTPITIEVHDTESARLERRMAERIAASPGLQF